MPKLTPSPLRPHRMTRRLAGAVAAAVLGCAALTAGAQEQEQVVLARVDPLDLPLETLVEADVVSAASFARRVTDSASAVSVLTQADIRRYGWRSLGEVLDHMRGLHVPFDGDYTYLGVRGLGGLGSLAGRVQLLIDGVPANDRMFSQLYLGNDGPIDVALIERVEYAPGSGSAMYGHNALMGVINVVTRRGRDIGGFEASALAGQHDDHALRLTWGERRSDGLEWLLSGSVHGNDGRATTDGGRYDWMDASNDRQLLAKLRWGEWSAQVSDARRTQQLEPTEDGLVGRVHDDTRLWQLAWDSVAQGDWQASVHAMGGRNRYLVEAGGLAYSHSLATWVGLDARATYGGWDRHRLVAAVQATQDTTLDLSGINDDGQPWQVSDARRELGLSLEDQIQLSDQWQVTLGLRGDRRRHYDRTWSPRLAVLWAPAPNWQLKFSQGRVAGVPSPATLIANDLPGYPRGEEVTTQELVAEYRGEHLRAQVAAYRYSTEWRVLETLYPDIAPDVLKMRGIEAEVEWQQDGWLLRASQAWQTPRLNEDEILLYSPGHVTKLMLGAPLGQRSTLGVTVRHTAPYRDIDVDPATYEVLLPTRASRTVVDLTLRTLLWEGADLTLAVRNAAGAPTWVSRFLLQPPRNTRSAWVQLTARW